jgi:hypothetical protein
LGHGSACSAPGPAVGRTGGVALGIIEMIGSASQSAAPGRMTLRLHNRILTFAGMRGKVKPTFNKGLRSKSGREGIDFDIAVIAVALSGVARHGATKGWRWR